MVDRTQKSGPKSPVRERARKHLRGLLATGAVTGAAAKMTACIPVVCDPMPPPLVCDATQTTDYYLDNYWVSAQATWVLGAGNSWTVDVTVSTSATSSDGKIAFTADPVLVGATLGTVNRQETSVRFGFTPASGVHDVRCDLTISCNAAADLLKLRFDLSGVPDHGGSIPVRSAETEDR